MIYNENGLPIIDPNLLVIAITATIILGVLLLLLYVPSIEDFKKVEQERDKYKLQRDYYINQWSVEMISRGKSEEEIADMIVKKDWEIERTKKKAKVFAKLADKLRGVDHA